MSELEKRLQALPDNKRALLEKKLKERNTPGQASTEPRTVSPFYADMKDDAEQGMPFEKDLHFSLFFFSDDGSNDTGQKYRLLTECARFADQHGFKAIWTPERHFNRFGGLYPNPSLLGAALAMVTAQLEIRAGSVVLPLHNPLRVAEEWSVVDNLSGGRVSVAFASGWFINDFVFTDEPFENRKELMYQSIETIHRLWAGESLPYQRPDGSEVTVRLYPQPLQPRLPIWISSSGSLETYRKAGEIGAHLLTSLIGQSLEEIAPKIALYRSSLAEHGFDPSSRTVALMLHTFIGTDPAEVRQIVHEPMISYLRSNLDLHAQLAKNRKSEIDRQAFSAQDEAVLLEHAFERYYQNSALFGTPTTSQPLLKKIAAIGVDEIACLIDFGLDLDTVIGGLQQLSILQEYCKVADPVQSLH